jgi:signal transduction histidine kinase
MAMVDIPAGAIGSRFTSRLLAWAGGIALLVPLVFGLAMALGVLGSSAGVVSTVAFVIAPLGAAALLLGWAPRYSGRERAAWTLMGTGVAMWWIAEVIWQWYVLVVGVDTPYPSVADIFYVLGYPIIGMGMILLPHVRLQRWERLRLALDTTIGALALIGLAWVLYLSEYLSLSGWGLVAFLDAFYPITDLLLAAALLVMSLRRSRYTIDYRMVALALGVAATTAADVSYLGLVAEGTYVEGSPIDALWLLGYAGFALAGFLGRKPPTLRDAATRPMTLWQLVAPYVLVVSLGIATVDDVVAEGATDPVLLWVAGLVAILVFLRQAVAIRENRMLVERQRDELVASISHELRTPLTAVTGFTEMLREGGLSADEQAEMLAIVDSQAQHLNRIVVDLVAVARDKVGATPPVIESLDLATVMRDAVVMAAPPDTSPLVQIPPGVTVAGDLARTTQVIVNLVTNAYRYGRGGVEVVARRVGDHVAVEVHDDGDGVPKRHQDSMWERFERGAHRLNATVPGSGIGLYVVRSLVEAQGGRVSYERSDRLGGACFGFTLPAA